jgi:hypothetical protein
VGSQPLHRGREGIGEEEPRSDASSQVESEGSEPPLLKIYIVLLCNVFFYSRGRGSLRLSKTQGSQTYTNHLVVRTPLYRYTTDIARGASGLTVTAQGEGGGRGGGGGVQIRRKLPRWSLRFQMIKDGRRGTADG